MVLFTYTFYITLKKEPIFGSWLLKELKKHGYQMSAGTLYPLLHKMELANLLEREEKTVEGKNRTDYRTTEKGHEVLMKAKEKAYALFKEIKD